MQIAKHNSSANLHFAFCILHFAMLLLLSGCVGYQVGTGSLYAPDVATVYVPMIESDSYRRDLGERLTEAVVKEIELKTPYKVVEHAGRRQHSLGPLDRPTRGARSSKTRSTIRAFRKPSCVPKSPGSTAAG